ncbi:ribosome-binding factor A, putative [Plasmodium vivax]|uniref:Ribosome-binding factor A, putative n=1 Tax=Plasmodium vivax TaxID=5855 RepID=A0A565A3G7_PLAVI|nr:ribosome-binding factor A, putative [Plasmodium vivax]
MSLSRATKWAVSFTKGRKTPFSTFRGWKKKDKYDDLENKHLYWSINNMKKEFLEGESNDNFVYSIERDKMEEHISDVVGINSSIPDNEAINEGMEKCLPREGGKGEFIPKDKLERMGQIFNPTLKVFVDKEEGDDDLSVSSLLRGSKWGKRHSSGSEFLKDSPPGGIKGEGKLEVDGEAEKRRGEDGEMFPKRSSCKETNGGRIAQPGSTTTHPQKSDSLVRETEKRESTSMGATPDEFEPNLKSSSLQVKRPNCGRGGRNKQKDEGANTTKETITKEQYNFPSSDKQEEDSLFNYESLKGKGLYQDLTHDEYQRMKELYIKKCDVDRKIRWFKMSSILNPVKEAKSIVKAQRLSEDAGGKKGKKNGEGQGQHSIEAGPHSIDAEESTTNMGSTKRMELPPVEDFPLEDDIKPYYQEEGNFSQKIKKICEQNQYDEIVSRIRMKIRKEKMENSKIMKEKIPNVARHILDPIKYHVNRRRVRTEKLLHTHLEQLLNCNNSYFRFYLLNGLSISIHHLEMKTTRSLCKIVYTLLNKNVHHDMIKDKLDKVAFVLRKLLARKLQLGYTPPLKFVPLQEEQEKKVKNLHYYKLYSKCNFPALGASDARERGAQLMDFYGRDLAGF